MAHKALTLSPLTTLRSGMWRAFRCADWRGTGSVLAVRSCVSAEPMETNMYTSNPSFERPVSSWVGTLAGVAVILATTFAYYDWVARVLH